MDHIRADDDFQDMGLFVSNSTDQSWVAAGIQSMKPYGSTTVMDPFMTAACPEAFKFSITQDPMEPGFITACLDDFEVPPMSNAMQAIVTDSGLPNMEPHMVSGAMDSPLVPFGLQDAGPPSKLSIAPPGREKWASKDNWTRLRPTIKCLYVDEGRKLKDIMAIMEKEHGFKAT